MTGFICHDEYYERTLRLSDEELGHMFRALMLYHAGRHDEIPDFIGSEGIAFDFIKDDIDYMEVKCETNKRNRKGTKDNERERTKTDDNESDRTLTNDNETQQNALYKDKDKVKDKVKDKDKKKDIQEKFDLFWSAYPRHEAKSVALKAFEKLNPSEELLQTMLDAIEKWKQTDQWNEDKGQYIPHPATWINQRRWEDEPPKAKQKKTVVAQNYEQRDYSGVQDELSAQQDREMEEYLLKEGGASP